MSFVPKILNAFRKAKHGRRVCFCIVFGTVWPSLQFKRAQRGRDAVLRLYVGLGFSVLAVGSGHGPGVTSFVLGVSEDPHNNVR